MTGDNIPEKFIEDNLLSDYYLTFYRSYNLYVTDLYSLNNDHRDDLLKLLISGLIVHFIFFFLFSVFVSFVIKNI